MLKPILFNNKKDFEKWKSFLINNNVHEIHRWSYPNINIVLSHLGQFPRGFIYVPEGYDEKLSHLKALNSGQVWGFKTGVFDILTYIKDKWFYFEDP